MKFKTIFILFNAVILFSFIFVAFMPLIMAGMDYAGLFWKENWYLGVFFFVVICALNTYFILNRKVFGFLETEDWTGLASHLEQEIFGKNRVGRQKIRLLVNTYLVTSRLHEIKRLETWIREHKPSLLPPFALSLGLPYLLENDPVSMEAYYGEFVSMRNIPERNWIRFSYAFALTLQSKFDDAKMYLLDLSVNARESVIQLISAYFLSSFFLTDEQAQTAANNFRTVFVKRFSPAAWKRFLSRSRNNIAVVIMKRIIQEAEGWVFGNSHDHERLEKER